MKSVNKEVQRNTVKMFETKKLFIKLSPLRDSDLNKSKLTCKTKANLRKAVTQSINNSKFHNLRQPKNCLGDSTLGNPFQGPKASYYAGSKANGKLPVYKKTLLSDDAKDLKQINNKVDIEVQGNTDNMFLTKKLFIKLSPLKDQVLQQLKCKPKVNFECHNLRKQQPKNYLEDSTSEKPVEGPKASCYAGSKANGKLPIYKKTKQDEGKDSKQIKDVYEFADFSPKENKCKKRREHKSSILFDKETYEILKKIEEKEVKAKKKVVRKKKNLEKIKSYEQIVNKIVSNVMEKISNKKISPTKSNSDLLQNKGTIKPINNFQEEINIIVHNPAHIQAKMDNHREAPCSKDSTTVTKPKPAVNNEISSINNVSLLNISDVIDPTLLRNIESCDNSDVQKDIESSFGFDVPVVSTPLKSTKKKPINILNNIVLKQGISNIGSPNDFNNKLPNANSTMMQTRIPERNSSPWRANWINIRHNPHFVSLKDNALPRVNQEMVLEHTLVEGFENNCSKVSNKQPETPLKNSLVQSSILDFVNSNLEKEKVVLQMSLFDYEAFNSPEKSFVKTPVKGVQAVKRNILGSAINISSSTPTKRRPLADIGNISGEHNSENATYFGFDESSEINPRNSPVKRKRMNNNNSSEENDENSAAKPYRFDTDKCKSYSRKSNRLKKHVAIVEPNATPKEDKSVSIDEISNEENIDEIHLFEEPEEMLDRMSPVHINEKKSHRKRLDSCDSETSDYERKKKKRKKTKLEIDREIWAEDFNKMCEEIDRYELELE